MTGLQTKAEGTICSNVGDVLKHENFKKLSKNRRIEILQEVYDKYGVRSNEFFVQAKPFIMWTVYKHLRGMSADLYLEDLVNTAYEQLIIAFEGGMTTYYNKQVYKEPIYGSPEYYEKYKNIGELIMDETWSAVSKFRSRNFRRQSVKEDKTHDISERIGFTDFEEKYNLNYESEVEYTKYFKYFKFNNEFIDHLKVIRELKPKNNILFNFMLWQEKLAV